jgi:hypothetical protein
MSRPDQERENKSNFELEDSNRTAVRDGQRGVMHKEQIIHYDPLKRGMPDTSTDHPGAVVFDFRMGNFDGASFVPDSGDELNKRLKTEKKGDTVFAWLKQVQKHTEPGAFRDTTTYTISLEE